MTSKTDEELEAERDAEDRKIMAAMNADAVLYIRNAADMTEEGKVAVASWLRTRAEDLLANGHNYSFLFTGRFNPED
jgi:anthranilate phosphoribosyltransferase